jgi:hypothetical protein
VVDGNDVANTGNGNNYERANQVGNPNRSNKSKGEWFNIDAFAVPAKYTFGNAGRNSLTAQRWINLDTSVIRSFPIWRENRFEFRAEAFNMFNHPIFSAPDANIANYDFIKRTGTFGTISSQANSNRQLQLSGKIVF